MESSPSTASLRSAKDTPVTRQTHLSPEDTQSLSSRVSTRNSFCGVSPPFLTAEGKALLRRDISHDECHSPNEQDPFLSPSASKMHLKNSKQRLSAKAHIFEPWSVARENTDRPSQPIQSAACISGSQSQDESHAIIPQSSYEASSVSGGNERRDTHVQASVQRSDPSQMQKFLSLQPTRYVVMTGVSTEYPRILVDALLAIPVVSQSRVGIADRISSHGTVVFRYDDLRCAEAALSKIRTKLPSWACYFASHQCWSELAHFSSLPSSSAFEGHVLASLVPYTRDKGLSLYSDSDIRNQLVKLTAFLSGAGDIKSSECILANPTILVMKIEFYSLHAADTASSNSSFCPFQDVHMHVLKYGENYSGLAANPISQSKIYPDSLDDHQVLRKIHSEFRTNNLTMMTRQSKIAVQPVKFSWQCSDEISHSLEAFSINHNIVDIGRIKRGIDVRTTIMLRNIPNKVDQPMLKDIVDETSHGKYDFMYLRIDFANNCNVGYAFINFEDSTNIIDFVEAVAGKRWNRFNSDKIAEVSYATIQGKDCLVQKFRNSSVMLEAPLFRPKIYYTGDGPLLGQEEKFPSPDNHSKMRRSLENAEHVGLFAPRAGQRFRDEQRRRRSRFDRGTRLAGFEDWEGDGVVAKHNRLDDNASNHRSRLDSTHFP